MEQVEIKFSDKLSIACVITGRKKANDIVAAMKQHINIYGYVSLDMLFDIIYDGLDPDSIIGWRDLEKVNIRGMGSDTDERVMVHMPEPKEIFWKEVIGSVGKGSKDHKRDQG